MQTFTDRKYRGDVINTCAKLANPAAAFRDSYEAVRDSYLVRNSYLGLWMLHGHGFLSVYITRLLITSKIVIFSPGVLSAQNRIHFYSSIWDAEIGEHVHVVCSSPVMDAIDMLLLQLIRMAW